MATTLPPGFRFHPTDVEVIKYYLKRKVLGKKLASDVIAKVDIYKNEPWDLPDKSYLKGRDLKWYFFCPRHRKYSNGGRINRATENGYWKTTGKDRVVLHNSKTVGMIKTLVFHKGRPPKGDRTDWVMHEYRLDDKDLADRGVVQDAFVLCTIFQKDGPGPRNGSQYGAPFKEDDWIDDEEVSCGGAHALSVIPAPLLPSNHENSSGGVEIMRTTWHDVISLSDLEPTEEGLSLSDIVWDDHSQVQGHDDLLSGVSCGGHALSNEKSSEDSEILFTSNGDGFSLADPEPTEYGLYLSEVVQDEDSDLLSMMNSFWEDSIPPVYKKISFSYFQFED